MQLKIIKPNLVSEIHRKFILTQNVMKFVQFFFLNSYSMLCYQS